MYIYTALLLGELGVRRRQELVAREDGVGAGQEHHRLGLPTPSGDGLGMDLLGEFHAPSRQADHGLGHHQARRGDGTHHVPPGDALARLDLLVT